MKITMNAQKATEPDFLEESWEEEEALNGYS